MENNEIANFVSNLKFNNLKIEEIKTEHYKDFPEILNGVRRVKISYPH